MNQEFDELVRDSMTWFTDGVDVPAGFAARARRHLRRRHRATVGLLATVTAVAAAAAVLAGALTTGSVPQHPEAKSGAPKSGGQYLAAQTTAVVIGRVNRALAKAAATDPVAYTSQTTRGIRLFMLIPHGGPAEVHASVTETWSRGPLEHVEFVTRTGRVVLGMQTDLRSGKSIQTTVSYQHRVWWRGTYQAFALPKPGFACTLGAIDRTPAQWEREVRTLLSCGAAVAGYERVDGVNAIKLKLSSSYKRACAGASYRPQCQPQSVGWSGVMWADASTYLPVRLVSHGQRYSFRVDFRWLAPTAPNLARLHQPIPAGFRRV